MSKKIFNKSIKAMNLMSQAFSLLTKAWDEADDDDQLHLFEDMNVLINKTIKECSNLSWDEAEALLIERIEELEEFQKEAHDEYVKHVWDMLEDVPFADADDEDEAVSDIVLEVDFRQWKAGTDRLEIWNWFDNQHSKGVAYLMGLQTQLTWSVPTSVNKTVDGILKFINEEFEIRQDRNVWLLIDRLTNKRWSREGVNRSQNLKDIAEGFVSK